MLKRLLSTIVAAAACIAVSAQGTCVINGDLADCTVADGKKIKKVALVRTNEHGQEIEVATAKVKKGKYSLKYELAKDEPVLMHRIKGFGEGKDVEVFVEPGEVLVAHMQGIKSIVCGTPSNDLYLEFYLTRDAEKAVLELPDVPDHEIMKIKAELIRMLIDNNASPVAPLMIERTLLPILTPAYAEQMLNTVAVSLHGHPYYLSLRNKVLANNLKVGNEVPDIQLPLINGEKKQLADFRGKYIVLNFWANGCAKSDAMLDEIEVLHDILKENPGQVVIVSFALENDKAAWENTVKSKGMEHEDWLNACDGFGADSPVAKLLGVDKTPRIVVVEPEGRAVSLDMDVDELVIRIEQILSGDLYYLDQEK